VLLFARVADTLSAHGHRVLAYVPDQRWHRFHRTHLHAPFKCLYRPGQVLSSCRVFERGDGCGVSIVSAPHACHKSCKCLSFSYYVMTYFRLLLFKRTRWVKRTQLCTHHSVYSWRMDACRTGRRRCVRRGHVLK
jgi:hypothetical protein